MKNTIKVGVKLEGLGKHLKSMGIPRTRAHIITHPRLKSLYGNRLAKDLRQVGFETSFGLFPSGEHQKNLKTVQTLYSSCAKAKLRRKSLVIALGGGVAGDVAGFVAATYLRGIKFVNVPTTLLAMVDAAIGGKTGVDLPQGKNLVGAFWPPALVWCDLSTLDTLPEREWKTGMAEIVKYGVIKDTKLFRYLEDLLPPWKGEGLSYPLPKNVVERLVKRSARIKAQVVSRDEFETKGLRQILNFGHTVAHGLEASTFYKSFTHGEAVAIGMCTAGRIAVKLGLFNPRDLARLENLLVNVGLPTLTLALGGWGRRPQTPRRGERIQVRGAMFGRTFWDALYQDKKIEGDALRFVLPTKIGHVVLRDVPKKIVKETLL